MLAMSSSESQKPSSVVNAGDTYSLVIGMVYVFNLILGTGVLTMPNVFAKAGYVLGIVFMSVLCFMSFLHLTFVVEAMANANFIKVAGESKDEPNKKERFGLTEAKGCVSASIVHKSTTQNVSTNSDISTMKALDEMSPMKDQFAINCKFEIGSLTEMFLPRWFSILFFVSIVLYMFGDLVIYNAMMSKSLRDVVCTFNYDCNTTNLMNEQCWAISSLTRTDVYRLLLLAFMVPLIPLTYAGLTKNKVVQVITIILRWVAFFCMVGVAINVFTKGQGSGKPEIANIYGFPKMFGVCVYAFMCHHSLPSLLTPVAEKKHLYRGMIIDYVLVIFCYFLITLTGIFAFGHIKDVYTLNFVRDHCKDLANSTSAADIPVLNIFIPAYPVFTTFSSYTIIALTLINNLKVILSIWIDVDKTPLLKYSLPLIGILPPLIISFFTEDVGAVVGYVGSYTGSLIQYVFPTALAYYSRDMIQSKHIEPYLKQRLNSEVSSGDNIDNASKVDKVQIYRSLNPFISHFQHRYWLYGSAVWWVLSVVLVTLNHIFKK